MALFKKQMKIFKKKMIAVKKFRPVFTTIDGNTHLGVAYNYGIADRLTCSIPEFLMSYTTDDGYLKDNKNVMYPLANIVSIDWKLEDEKEIEDRFGEFTIFITQEDVDKCCTEAK